MAEGGRMIASRAAHNRETLDVKPPDDKDSCILSYCLPEVTGNVKITLGLQRIYPALNGA
jgi:hypothetical protein